MKTTSLRNKIAIAVFVAALCFGVLTAGASGQDVTLPRAEAIEALRAIREAPLLRQEIKDLKLLTETLRANIVALEKAARTPCTIAIDRTKDGLVFWLKKLEEAHAIGHNPLKKQTLNIIKDKRKEFKKTVAAQCGYKPDSSRLKKIWNGAIDAMRIAAPVGLAILLSRN